jgi:hypothetical protein
VTKIHAACILGSASGTLAMAADNAFGSTPNQWLEPEAYRRMIL